MQVAHVFDAFGTLFDTAAAGPLHRAILGEATGQVVELWRRKQLEYTWLRSLMEAHADFTRVTEDALRYALRASGVAATEEEVTSLMGAYHELPCFPEVPEALAGLQASGARLAVLSNGDPVLLAQLLRHNGLADAFAAPSGTTDSRMPSRPCSPPRRREFTSPTGGSTSSWRSGCGCRPGKPSFSRPTPGTRRGPLDSASG